MSFSTVTRQFLSALAVLTICACFQNIPVPFTKRTGWPSSKDCALVTGLKSPEWPLTMANSYAGITTRFSRCVCNGWLRFQSDHDLHPGDLLVFEVVDKRCLVVHIVRVEPASVTRNPPRACPSIEYTPSRHTRPATELRRKPASTPQLKKEPTSVIRNPPRACPSTVNTPSRHTRPAVQLRPKPASCPQLNKRGSQPSEDGPRQWFTKKLRVSHCTVRRCTKIVSLLPHSVFLHYHVTSCST